MKTIDLAHLRTLILDESSSSPTYGRFTAEPFERGYGHTIGNALRRILLSSLEGAAISAVRIKGALHEFAILKGVKEDVAEIILNLKRIRVKMFTDDPQTVILRVKRAGAVLAKNIEANSTIEILNPDQVIATLDHGVELEMEMEISRGRGYVLAEENTSHWHAANTIMLDALYSPITKVNYEVENTRVEQFTNYDKLILEIWTDGSVSPADALTYSAKVLKTELTIFTGVDHEAEKPAEKAAPEDLRKKEILAQPLSVMDFSVRSANCLVAAGLKTIGDLTVMSEAEVIDIRNCGKRSLDEIKSKLEAMGLSLTDKGAIAND